MTSREEKISFANRFSDEEWSVLAANPRFINALNESTDEADHEARRILDMQNRPGVPLTQGVFPSINVRKITRP